MRRGQDEVAARLDDAADLGQGRGEVGGRDVLDGLHQEDRVGLFVLQVQARQAAQPGSQEGGVAAEALLDAAQGLGGGVRRQAAQALAQQPFEQPARAAAEVLDHALAGRRAPGEGDDLGAEDL